MITNKQFAAMVPAAIRYGLTGSSGNTSSFGLVLCTGTMPSDSAIAAMTPTSYSSAPIKHCKNCKLQPCRRTHDPYESVHSPAMVYGYCTNNKDSHCYSCRNYYVGFLLVHTPSSFLMFLYQTKAVAFRLIRQRLVWAT